MSIIEIILGVCVIVFSAAIVGIILTQEGKQQNAGGFITGASSDTFLNKHKGRSKDAFLARWTRFIAISIFVLVIAINVISYFHFLGA
ncbi:MAG: preprotein translocase subunit SecG [Candidatus Improbicoccus pseudotrichonymphae]|uniref:Protein-export membrane protein SecG n=1 Tax=Candidatus Improbicoccus pseudotrichonymphae TaxID=3033792 RepID=A0AA48I0Q6_9FIRM|nr:MAG: preprotein translocase subunit SecG [Candidatus Improbicoccus pseudotrichonymphae]